MFEFYYTYILGNCQLREETINRVKRDITIVKGNKAYSAIQSIKALDTFYMEYN